MHELSLAMEVISLAGRETATKNLKVVREILIEVGTLSGVEAEAFQWGLEMLVKGTILEHAEIQVVRTPGKGKCSSCNTEFEMQNRLDICPGCQCFPSEISGGTEFRVVSLVAE
ncbi:MAG: hydrogenase maturation nickel metallochaperone HypA [Bacteroidota bacterium]